MLGAGRGGNGCPGGPHGPCCQGRALQPKPQRRLCVADRAVALSLLQATPSRAAGLAAQEGPWRPGGAAAGGSRGADVWFWEGPPVEFGAGWYRCSQPSLPGSAPAWPPTHSSSHPSAQPAHRWLGEARAASRASTHKRKTSLLRTSQRGRGRPYLDPIWASPPQLAGHTRSCPQRLGCGRSLLQPSTRPAQQPGPQLFLSLSWELLALASPKAGQQQSRLYPQC